MKYEAKTPAGYIKLLPEERQKAMRKVRKVNLPKGFKEGISYGMIGYFVPHSIYPNGYHANPKLPLPFINIASQKNFIAVYHIGIYADKKLMDWFTKEYTNSSKNKLDMGKSCIRLKKMDLIPFELIGKLASKITVDLWIDIYEKNIRK